MDKIKISFGFVLFINFLWIFWLEKHTSIIVKKILIILSGIIAGISFIKNLDNLLVVFFMVVLGMIYTCIFLFLTCVYDGKKNLKISEVENKTWIRLLFILLTFWSAWIIL